MNSLLTAYSVLFPPPPSIDHFLCRRPSSYFFFVPPLPLFNRISLFPPHPFFFFLSFSSGTLACFYSPRGGDAGGRSFSPLSFSPIFDLPNRRNRLLSPLFLFTFCHRWSALFLPRSGHGCGDLEIFLFPLLLNTGAYRIAESFPSSFSSLLIASMQSLFFTRRDSGFERWSSFFFFSFLTSGRANFITPFSFFASTVEGTDPSSLLEIVWKFNKTFSMRKRPRDVVFPVPPFPT